MNDAKTTVRIAPSPTGPLHVGTARAALFNFLYAKKHGGRFVLRIEDTDSMRSKKEFEDDIFEGLAWLGIETDETYRQSERTDIYKKHLEQLVEDDKAYISREPHPDDETKISEVVRLRNPGKEITFDDKIRGEVTFDTSELGDFIIARSMDAPLYHLAVVIDDWDMGVTDVIRGEDHISNTPRQILIAEALGAPRPTYAHLPLILAPDRSKLSKRHGATSLSAYRDMGFLPEALVNYLALLGWNPDSDQELFTLDELVEAFAVEEVHKSGAVFDMEKLRWFNREHLKRRPAQETFEALKSRLPSNVTDLPGYSDERLKKLQEELLERISVYSDLDQLVEDGEVQYFFVAPEISAEELPGKNATPEEAKRHLEHTAALVKEIPENEFESASIHEKVFPYAESEGKGAVLWPMRFALCGKKRSPDPFFIASVLGKDETISRLKNASAIIE